MTTRTWPPRMARRPGGQIRPVPWMATGRTCPAGPARLPDSAGRRLRTAGPATATNDSLPAPAPSPAGSRRSGAAAVPRRRGAVRRVPLSEFGQLGARRHEPHTARTEIHVQGGVNLDADDPAEAVRIVGNLIPHGELLRRRGGRAGEGTSGQEAPGRGAGWLHHYQYAPAGSMRLPGRSPLVPPGWPGYRRTARRAGARRYRPPAVSAASHKPGRQRRRGSPRPQEMTGRSCEIGRYVRPRPR